MSKPDSKEDAPAPLKVDFRMTSEEKRGGLWGKQFQAIENRIHELRVANDNAQDEAKTAAIRTEIKVLKGLLKNDPTREFSEPRRAVTQDELAAGE